MMDGRSRLLPLLVLALATTAAGCRETARCSPGTILLRVALAGPALMARQILVQVSVDGVAAASGTVPRPAGEREGTVGVPLQGRYREGAAVAVLVRASTGLDVLAEERITARLDPGCSVLSVTLGNPSRDAGDAPPADGSDGRGPLDAGADPPSGDAASDSPIDSPIDTPPTCSGVCQPPMTMACDRCGIRTCGATCEWGECQNQGVCQANAQEPCGRCLTGQRTCSASCTWGECENEVGCQPNTTRPCERCPGLIQTCSPDCGWSACNCPDPKRVFVSRDRFTGDMGGLAGAHALCTRAANDAGLTGTYQAWLSTAQQGPSTFMVPSPGPYVLPRGEMVATSWADLVDGTLLRPIDRDERGDPANPNFVCQGGEVWTNTTAAGSPRGLLDCGGWTTQVGTSTAGNVKLSTAGWTDSSCSSISCSTALNIYCVEQ